MPSEHTTKVLADAEAALTSTSPLHCIGMAGAAGLQWAHLKRAAADKEAGRKELQQAIQKELMEAGANKTTAEPASRADARYVAYLEELAQMGEDRDRAEVLYKVLRTRARLLGGEDLD